MHVGKPPPPSGASGSQRPGLALFGTRARTAAAVETTTLLTRDRPLPAEAVTVTDAGAATLLVFAVRAGLCHLSSNRRLRKLTDAARKYHLRVARASRCDDENGQTQTALSPGVPRHLLLGEDRSPKAFEGKSQFDPQPT
jgi:hypothetical protein